VRTISAPSATEITGPITQPGWFVQLDFFDGSTRLCSFGTLTWNALSWTGQNFQVDNMAGDGKRARVSIWDPTAAFRTLALSNGGIRNRGVTIWEAQRAALGAGDPNMTFFGVGDAVRWNKGRTDIDCARLNSGVMLAPRQCISPATGFNFLAAPGTVIQWGDSQITLQPARR